MPKQVTISCIVNNKTWRHVKKNKDELYLQSYPKPEWAVDQIVRHDKGGLVEDICKHGVGHPNRGWIRLHDPSGELGFGIHGCDSCCRWENYTYKDKELLYQLYVVEQKSVRAICKILGCDSTTIWRWLKKYDISIRNKSEAQSGELHSQYRPIEERFWEKVDVQGEDECWEWMAGKFSSGYGSINVDCKTRRAHVVSWEMRFGAVPSGMIVCHKCNNPSCVNPNHLFLGTQADNVQDMVKKDRQAKGKNHGMSKLKSEQVIEIRDRYSAGKYTYKKLSKEYGVHHSTISDIVNRKTWKHI